MLVGFYNSKDAEMMQEFAGVGHGGASSALKYTGAFVDGHVGWGEIAANAGDQGEGSTVRL